MASNLKQVSYTVYKGSDKIAEGTVPYIFFHLVLTIYGIPNKNSDYRIEMTHDGNTLSLG